MVICSLPFSFLSFYILISIISSFGVENKALSLVYWRRPGHTQTPHKKGTTLQYGVFIFVLHICTYLCTIPYGRLEFPRGVKAGSNLLYKVTQNEKWRVTYGARHVLKNMFWTGFLIKTSIQVDPNTIVLSLFFCLFLVLNWDELNIFWLR